MLPCQPRWAGIWACPNWLTGDWVRPRPSGVMTLVASALAGGDCIDEDVSGTAAWRQGTFLRSFRWGHVRQLDEPGAAGPGLVGWGRMRATRLHHLRATPAITRGWLPAASSRW